MRRTLPRYAIAFNGTLRSQFGPLANPSVTRRRFLFWYTERHAQASEERLVGSVSFPTMIRFLSGLFAHYITHVRGVAIRPRFRRLSSD